MAKRKPSERVGDIQGKIEERLWIWTNRIATKAKEVYAPFGWSGALKNGIRALRPVVRKGIVIGEIVSEARNDAGESYARRQHNESLRHFTSPPGENSFVDYYVRPTKRKKQAATDREGRYKGGYYRAIADGKFSKYKTQYLTRALKDHKDDMLADIRRAFR